MSTLIEAPPAVREELLLDRLLPAFDATVFHHCVVDAPVERAYAAVYDLDLAEVTRSSRLLRVLIGVRGLPERLLRRAPAELAERVPLAEIGSLPGWTVLAETPGRELVVGAVGRFWTPQIEWLDVLPEAFPGFDRPGYGKIAWGFSVRPYGERRALVTEECRTRTTDPASRRRFLAYWKLVGGGASYVMGRSLPVVQAQAEMADLDRET